MVTSLSFKGCSSATDKSIRLICAPVFKSAFPCLLVLSLSHPRISTRTVGNIVLPFVEFILGDGKLVSDGISSHRNPTSVNLKDG